MNVLHSTMNKNYRTTMYPNYEDHRSTVTKNDASRVGPVKIKQDNLCITPLFVLRFVSPPSPDNDVTHRDMSGTTEIEKPTEGVIPTTIGGVVTGDQLNDLEKMDAESQEISIASDGQIEGIEFAQFSYSEASDFLRSLATPSNKQIEEPLYKFQLQTRDSEE